MGCLCLFFRNISTVAVFCLNLYEIFEVLGLDQLQNSVFRVAIIFMCINQWLGIFSISIFSYRIVNGEVESSRHKTTLSRRPNPAYKNRTNYLLRNEANETYKALYFFFFINNAGSERLRFAWESDKCLILGFGILCSPDLAERKRGIRYRSEESGMSSRVENRCSQIARVVRANLELSSTKITRRHYYLTNKNAPGVKNPYECVE